MREEHFRGAIREVHGRIGIVLDRHASQHLMMLWCVKAFLIASTTSLAPLTLEIQVCL
jgi:hypothetical protein